jgi:cobaltochelatase CobT
VAGVRAALELLLPVSCFPSLPYADLCLRVTVAPIARVLKADLFREGIDGEAVGWALRRAAARDESRRLLLVVSDGSPMDSATNLANDAHYLDHHLKDVVAAHEARGAEIYGVGVGLDLSPYYSRSHVLDLSGSVGPVIFRELIAMIARGARR